MRFRPCIDLHNGKVKQIVGGTLSDRSGTALITNFEATRDPAYYADMYYRDGLEGGHVIMLGPGNRDAAAMAVGAHPGFLQLGGGITPGNAGEWLGRGAAKVIVTSFIFVDGELEMARLKDLCRAVGREKLVLDLSCRRRESDYVVACDRWQTLTSMTLSAQALEALAEHCSEFLVHAVDVEGKQAGTDGDLIGRLARWSPIPVTYAGGVSSLDDVKSVEELGQGRVDFTVGSALDIFGGSGVRYRDLVSMDVQRR